MSFNLKIKTHTYEISEEDQFMDNSACVQLLTQSKERILHCSRPHPVLNKRNIKEISEYKRIDVDHSYGSGVQIFKLEIEKS
tara:strand:+ start:24996 stop:25241 length:246 start_codon:yes stop_codon:yes gene_type:complete